jgi:hypothetical protein
MIISIGVGAAVIPRRCCEHIGSPDYERHHCRQIGTDDSRYNRESCYGAIRRAIGPVAEIATVLLSRNARANRGGVAMLQIVLYSLSSVSPATIIFQSCFKYAP